MAPKSEAQKTDAKAMLAALKAKGITGPAASAKAKAKGKSAPNKPEPKEKATAAKGKAKANAKKHEDLDEKEKNLAWGRLLWRKKLDTCRRT
jgi:hypothetical protein